MPFIEPFLNYTYTSCMLLLLSIFDSYLQLPQEMRFVASCWRHVRAQLTTGLERKPGHVTQAFHMS